jgi:hypothetical protein
MCIRIGSDVPTAQRVKHAVQLIASPVKKRLRVITSCGLTPQKLALTFCIGFAFGVIPLVWGTSLICIMLAHVLRLNHIALQTVNYLLWPVHLALLFPFFKFGGWLFPWGPAVPPHIFASLIRNPGSSLHFLGLLTLKAVAAWMVTVLPSALLVYGILMATAAKSR